MTDIKPSRSSVQFSGTQPKLQIAIRGGTGTGSTKLAAFDAALVQAGVANYNLIRLSSVIPPGAVIEPLGREAGPNLSGGWGDRLYVVLAECRVDTIHEEAWAGIGWTQDPKTGQGLFVEHEGHSRPQVEADIRSSLGDLVANRPEVQFGEIGMLVEGAVCEGEPLCALAVATFESSPWRGEEIIQLS